MNDYILIQTKRTGYYGPGNVIIVPDHAAGRPRRFTVYWIPPQPSHKIKIIGRELTLAQSKKVAAKELEQAALSGKKKLKKINKEIKEFSEGWL